MLNSLTHTHNPHQSRDHAAMRPGDLGHRLNIRIGDQSAADPGFTPVCGDLVLETRGGWKVPRADMIQTESGYMVLVLVPPRGVSRVKTIKQGATEPITLAQDKLHPLQHETNNSN